MHDVMVFEQKGVDKDGRVVGEFRATGVRPLFTQRFKVFGYELPPGIFEN